MTMDYTPWNSPVLNYGVVAFPFSRASSQPRDWIQVLHIADGFFSELSHEGSQRILDWVVYPFSKGSPLPRNQLGSPAQQVYFSTGDWATKEAPIWFEHITRNEIAGSYRNSTFWLLSNCQNVFHSHSAILHSSNGAHGFQIFHVLTNTYSSFPVVR